MKVCACYHRVSTEGQRDRYSLSSQLELAKEFCNRMGFEPRHYEEVGSGGNISGRPIFNQLISDIQDYKIQAVWTVEFTRLTRGDEDETLFLRRLFTEYDVEVYILGERMQFKTAEDLLFYQIRSSVSAYERRKLKERMKRGIRQQINSGRRKVSQIFGYDYNEDGSVEINQREAEVIRFIYEKYDQGFSYNQLIHELLLHEYKRKNGKTNWNHSFLFNVLKQPRYIGKTYNTDDQLITDKNYNPIIEEELWNRVRSIHEKKKKWQRSNETRKGTYPLSGILKCGYCQTSWYRRSKMRRKKDGIVIREGFYHHFPDSKKALTCNQKPTTANQLLLEYLVQAAYFKNFEDYESIRGFFEEEQNKYISQFKTVMEQRDIYQQEILRLEKKRENIVEAIADGTLPHDLAKSQLDKLTDQQSALEEKRDNIVLPENINYQSLLDDFANEHVFRFWDYDGAKKKEIYMAVLKRIVIQDSLLILEFLNNETYEINFKKLDTEWKNRVDIVRKYYDNIE